MTLTTTKISENIEMGTKTPAVLLTELQPLNIRPMAYRIFSKKHGLNIKSNALKELADYLGAKFGAEWKGPKALQFLEEVAKLWKSQNRGVFLEGEALVTVMREVTAKHSIKKNTVQRDGNLDNFFGNKAERSDTVVDEVNTDMDMDTNVAINKRPPHPFRTGKSFIDSFSARTNSESEVITEKPIDWQDYLKVIDAYSQPKFHYNHIRKTFESLPRSEVISSESKIKLFSNTSLKDGISLFSNRYYLTNDRLFRNEHFQAPQINAMSKYSFYGNSNSEDNEIEDLRKSFTITAIKNLLGRNGQHFVLIGLLTKNMKGNWSLQDTTDRIELDLNQAFPHDGYYYAPGSIVIVDGIYTGNGKFVVSSIYHPPPERREKAIEAYGYLDFLSVHKSAAAGNLSTFGGRIDMGLKKRLHLLEKKYTKHKIVFLGCNIYLDNLNTFDALKKVFTKLSNNDDEPPVAIVFMGNFTSIPFYPSTSSSSTTSSSSQYKDVFDSLATLLESFPRLTGNSTFIFIPGDGDPWSSAFTRGSTGTWPQKPIPSIFRNRINRIVRKCIWATNPCRLVYLSQEIVITRDDIGGRFRRHQVIFPQSLIPDDQDANMTIEKESDEGPNMTIDGIEVRSSTPQVRFSASKVETLTANDLEARKVRTYIIRLKFDIQ